MAMFHSTTMLSKIQFWSQAFTGLYKEGCNPRPFLISGFRDPRPTYFVGWGLLLDSIQMLIGSTVLMAYSSCLGGLPPLDSEHEMS